jgi:type I restriction enzyme R subunit
MAKEAKARIKINKLLEQAGWRFFDDENGKASITLESCVALTPKAIAALGDNFERTAKGFIDYTLLDGAGFPLGIVEAKSAAIDPLSGKEQARTYAVSQNVRFIILSNGDLHYLWDREGGYPQVIPRMPTREFLENLRRFKKRSMPVSAETIIPEYIALTKNPHLLEEPDYINPATRQSYCINNGYRILRDYQIDAIKAVQKAADQGRDRFLLEMATGLGKTLIAAALIQLFLRTGNARRALFLVDRLELETQAFTQFQTYLKDFTTVIYKDSREDWRKAEVVITTIQSLSVNGVYQTLFLPSDFDMLISDEAHRSIGGNSRAVFDHFTGYKIGLTATPKDYLKNIDVKNISEKDPKVFERRLLMDTYKTFGCDSGEPTFRYSLIDGINGGYLVNPYVIDVRTEITAQLLSDKGYFVQTVDEEGGEKQETVFQTDFEKNFFNEKTNATFCQTFMENALCDPVSGEIGKTLVFCVSQRHAAKIAQILNEMASRRYPDVYNSDFAVQVTSSVTGAQEMAKQFALNRLNGASVFKEGYDTGKTRVCTTVGMMTTGYDCPDILNLVLMRPVFSPADFVQMKGRGTRKHTFKYTGERGETTRIEKTRYNLFDFFANCEYFEEKFNYDAALPLPRLTGAAAVEEAGIPAAQSMLVIDRRDPAISIAENAVPDEGMRVDREFWQNASRTLRDDADITAAVKSGRWEDAVRVIKERYENKPELFMNLEKIAKAHNVDRRVSWREVLECIFGLIKAFKKRDELIEAGCDAFIALYKPDDQAIPLIKDYIYAYITDESFRTIIEKKEFGSLALYSGFSLDDFKRLNAFHALLPAYIKEHIPLNIFL